jgi:hypothetical protein
MVTSMIGKLWLAENLPIQDGLYRADGPARTVRVDASAPGGLALFEPFDLEALLAADPEWVTCIDITVEKELPDGSGYLCCGEASHGSEGFFGRLDRNKNLVRVYLQGSNPFIEAVLDTTHATVTSSSEVSITVDLTSPEFGPAQSS